MISKVKIIAEAGVNHNGDLNLAKKLIDIAKDSGADFIKFQLFKAEELVTKKAKKAKYQIKTNKSKETQFDMLKKLEISQSHYKEILRYSKKKNIKCFSTAFDKESLFFLKQLGQPLFKVPSGEITNYPFLKTIGSFKSSVILSTGMSNLEEISKAIKVLIKFGTKKKNITVLHCTTEYPAPINEVNLKAMIDIKKNFSISVGYSDHTSGIEVSQAAVSLGAEIIEKHFTLNKKLPGPDHKASLEPKELKTMIFNIRNIEKALGKEQKKVTKSEKKNRLIIRKSIVAKREIKKGHILKEKDLTVKRPGTGISPMNWTKVIGSKAKKNYEKDELISL